MNPSNRQGEMESQNRIDDIETVGINTKGRQKMKRVLSIAICIMVLLGYSFVFAAEETKEIGRFQVVVR